MVFLFQIPFLVCWKFSILSASLHLSGMAPSKFSHESGGGKSQEEGTGESRGRKRQHVDMECTGNQVAEE